MDFVSDQLSNGRLFRVLNIVNDYSREMVGQLVSVPITGNQVARFLDELKEFRPFPKSIVCVNGIEYISKAIFFWSKESGVKLSFIHLGKPTQNAFVERLNCKFRYDFIIWQWIKQLLTQLLLSYTNYPWLLFSALIYSMIAGIVLKFIGQINYSLRLGLIVFAIIMIECKYLSTYAVMLALALVIIGNDYSQNRKKLFYRLSDK